MSTTDPAATSAPADRSPRGLTAAEVADRVADGRVNERPPGPTRTLRQILRANVFNPVNAIMLTLFALIVVAGYPRDGLFVGVVISNAVIGIGQELKARRELRRLEVLNAPIARVLRDGEVIDVEVDAVVADDVCDLGPGDQLVVDGEVLVSDGLELDESLLTGESDTIVKAPGDRVLSGSFVVAGGGLARATSVGAASYANKLTVEATEFKLVNSELRAGINAILKWLVIIIPPASLLLLWSLLRVDDGTWQEALQGAVAAAVAMVPDGLVLLTSLAFVAGVLSLARRQALAKELATVELLARVDTLCLDKTGTITTGEISFGELVPLGDIEVAEATDALGTVAHSDQRPNPTMAAIAGAVARPDGDGSDRWVVSAVEPFSSARKWASVACADGSCYWLGAPDIVLPEHASDARERVEAESSAGRRVLAMVRSPGTDPTVLTDDREPLALVLLEDTVRPDAHEILGYFVEQDVSLRIISGDSVATVVAVAERAGVPHTERHIDARTLPDDPEALAEAMGDTVVFGRVTPHQKQAMVQAFQHQGRVVGMTGDGVNDVLALKRADMGIAMGSGSSASRAVADLVLLDDKFATLPKVLGEGRKVINNIERVSNLFVTKAVYAVLLAAIIGLQDVPFPLLPRHLTLIGTFSIGVPGFFLALAPTTELVRPGFLPRVLRFSIPSGIAAGVAASLVYQIARTTEGVDLEEARTATAIALLSVGLVILVVVSRPLRAWKIGLAAAMGAAYVATMLIDALQDFFELAPPPTSVWAQMALVIAVASAVVIAVPTAVARLERR
ncbi:HAD-IC family P-type ATPase [soil metagenome]